MLETASFVEKTQTWTAGLIRTLCVAPTPLITARRYFTEIFVTFLPSLMENNKANQSAALM